MACIANAGMSDLSMDYSGPRLADEPDEHGMHHAFIRCAGVARRGWWKCDFRWHGPLRGWLRNWNPQWDP